MSIETTRKAWVDGYYLLLRPYPENKDCIELCTEPNENSDQYFGEVSIAFCTPESLRTLAKALELAARDMEESE
jgi:hypothetical protein